MDLPSTSFNQNFQKAYFRILKQGIESNRFEANTLAGNESIMLEALALPIHEQNIACHRDLIVEALSLLSGVQVVEIQEDVFYPTVVTISFADLAE